MEDPTATDAVRQVAQSIAPDFVLSTLTSDQSDVLFGAPISIKGELQLPDKQPIAGLAVRLEMLSQGETVWREIFQTVTESDGSLTLPLLLSKSASLRLSSDGSWERLGSQSAELSITVSRRISLTPPT